MYLNAHTYFSLRYGVLSPRQLVEAAVSAGVTTLALTDINNTSCTLEFVKQCKASGIKPVVGIEYRNAAGAHLYTGIARNGNGWQQLCAFLTQHSLDEKPLPPVPPIMDDTFIIYRSQVKPIEQFKANEFLAIAPTQANTIQAQNLHKHLHKLVAMQTITFLDDEGYRLHKILRAIKKNNIITRLAPDDIAAADERPRTREHLMAYYAAFPQLVTNADRLLEQCSISFETGLQINRRSYTGSRDGDMKLLTKLALSGCERRYPHERRKATERVQKELKVIEQMDFGAYFLITWDIVRYARSVGYFHVGRGSGANSIVAYCLGITDVNPIELDLYFERFINPHRASPPDFDIDFSWDERNDVTDYIFKRYGKEHTALLATYTTFQYNAAVRELGKVFGLPKGDIDAIVDALPKLMQGEGAYWQWTGRKG